LPEDPFVYDGDRSYVYINLDTIHSTVAESYPPDSHYAVISFGPAQSAPLRDRMGVGYDPTNGTVSEGIIDMGGNHDE